MGQTSSIQNEQIIRRIKPTPGSSGVCLRRKNTISIYSEVSHSILSVKVDFDMKLSDLRAIFPCENLQFLLDDQTIPPDSTLRELGISEKSLLKVVQVAKNSPSTADSSAESLESAKSIGPKPNLHSKPMQPVEDFSIGNNTVVNEQSSDFNFLAFAVPDVQIGKPIPKFK